jgi:hypothetical protein
VDSVSLMVLVPWLSIYEMEILAVVLSLSEMVKAAWEGRPAHT